jgi:glycosyltransferase involved in cell wall biosynthesis
VSSVDISVVIPAYRAWATLPLVLEAPAPQVRADDREAILVDSSGEDRSREIHERWPWIRVIVMPHRTPQGVARNIGASAAEGRALAFLDADAVPDPNWLDELARALTSGIKMVAGAILNGRSGNAWAQTAHILEFLGWTPPREKLSKVSSPVQYSRPAPASRILRDQYKHGVDFPSAQAVRDRRLGAAALHRALGLRAALRNHPAERRTAFLLAPMLALGLLAWTTGLARASSSAFSGRREPEGASRG